MITRQVPWDNLDRLVPGDLDEYWKQSLEFLKFVHPRWRAILGENNAIEAAERRDRLIEAEAKRLAGSDAPVIAAGSTGSMPATAKLLATIARLPHGALVLPGLDMDLDDAVLGADRRQRRRQEPRRRARRRPRAICHARPARCARNPARQSEPTCTAGSRTGASCWCPKPCARPPPPNAGRRAPRKKTSTPPPPRRSPRSA